MTGMMVKVTNRVFISPDKYQLIKQKNAEEAKIYFK